MGRSWSSPEISVGIRKVDANEEEYLVYGVGYGMAGFGEHGGAAGEQTRDEFAAGDCEVRSHGGEDGWLALF